MIALTVFKLFDFFLRGGGGGSKRLPPPVLVRVKLHFPGKGYSDFNQLRMSTKQKWGRYAVDTMSVMLLIRFYIYLTSWEFSKTFWWTLIPSFNVLIYQKRCSNSKPYIPYKIPFIILFVMVWQIILMESGGRSKMLAERYQYIDPQISDCLKSPLGSTDYNLAVSAVRKIWTTWSLRTTRRHNPPRPK